MDIIKNEKDRLKFYRQLNKALKPLKKALIEFKKSISKVDWKKINEELQEGGKITNENLSK